MTAGSVRGSRRPRLLVVGVDLAGAEVARLALGHGDDPKDLLASHGWDVLRVRQVARHPARGHLLTLTFEVEPAPDRVQRVALLTSQAPSPRNDDQLDLSTVVLSEGDVPAGEVAVRHQRVAAYAVVTSSRGLLMTQFSDQTGAQGQWGLPGGGLEAEEGPDRAVLREVWEESGQVIEVSELALIATSRWVGLAPGGQLEDYHAVRVIYRATCPEPTDPVVHDVGGTTASAAWLLPADLERLALTAGWRAILREVTGLGVGGAAVSEVVMAPDETDRPDHHHDHTDADDPSRPEPCPVDVPAQCLLGDDQAREDHCHQPDDDG
jgi:8-oxo-dGTP diphosphatase